MQLSTIRTRISELVRLSESVGDFASTIDSWINETYRRVSNEANWPWLLKHDILQTTTDITTGTASVAAADTALTFSSGPTPSIANDYRIQLTGQSDDWYDISAHTAGATSATLADAFLGTSNYSAGAYILRKYWYSLPSDLDVIVSLTEATQNTPIHYIDHRTLKQIFPDPETTNTAPRFFTLEGLDSSNLWRIRFYPVPSSKINVDLWYYLKITELSADTDSPIFPAKWHEILIWGALAFYGYMYRDDVDRQRIARENYEDLLNKMRRNLLPTSDQLIQLHPWDARSVRGAPGLHPLLLPSNYGRNYL